MMESLSLATSLPMTESLSGLMRERAEKLARYLNAHFARREELPESHFGLVESVRYSTLQEGSKRFRPVLAMLTAEALGQKPERVLPWAGAVECIHTYSLIHDDLPAMDDDDFRRGKPTNHKVFGEATAILAGDALLTEAFQLLATPDWVKPEIAIRLVSELALAAGYRGMVGGQAIDMGSKKNDVAFAELKVMHELKTGALIRVSAYGAALACGASEQQLAQIDTYSRNLGLAFQIADDLLDHDPADPETGSYPALLGADETKRLLKEATDTCLEAIASWPASAEPLRAIARYNCEREV